MTLRGPQAALQEGLALHRSGDSAAAAARYHEALRGDPDNADAHYYLALIACQQGRFAEGADLARKSLAAEPRQARVHVLLGRALDRLGTPGEALASFDRAIALDPNLAPAHGHRADVLGELGRPAEAIESYDRALALAPGAIEDWFNRGVALFAAGRCKEAIASFERVLAVKPDHVDAHLWRAKSLAALRRYDEAIDCVDRLIGQNRQEARAWLGRGNLLTDLDRLKDALSAYDLAVAANPNLAEAWRAKGGVLVRLARHEQAFQAFDRAFQLNPHLRRLAGQRIHAKQLLCDWTNIERESDGLLAAIRRDEPVSAAFPLLALPSSGADQLQCARLEAREQPVFPAVWQEEIYSHDRIRVGYLSADFREHAVAYLIAGLFEHHDRARFAVTALSHGPDQESPTRQRIARAVGQFIDVRGGSDQDVAEVVRRNEIDILVDLTGLTAYHRLGVLARRSAPVQVNYLGYPGTMGASFVDYILADPTVIPEAECRHHSEQVVWLPDSYQINDNKRQIAEAIPARGDCGLPESAFVFCSFNNSYKITPQIFDIWMRLLAAVEGGVLWLIEGDPAASANLRREAEKRGVSSRRIIFAPRADLPRHLARHRHADLFLDTLPYNAHTTASDALWACVPIITCLGSTFAGRVAASLLKAAGLDGLITNSLGEYEALALKLAREPAYLASIKKRLANNRNSCPLFDTMRTTRQIEAAYTMMWERFRRGEPARLPGDPRPIRIK